MEIRSPPCSNKLTASLGATGHLQSHVCPGARPLQTPKCWAISLQERRKLNCSSKGLRCFGLQLVSPCPRGCPKCPVCPWAKAGGSQPGPPGRVCSPQVAAPRPGAAGHAELERSKGGEGGLAGEADRSAPSFCYRWEFRHFPSPGNSCK